MKQEMKEQLSRKLTESINETSEFAKAFVSCENAAALRKVLQDNGFDVTEADVEELLHEGGEAIRKYQDTASDELSDTQLDEVAGGGALRGTVRLVASCALAFGFGALCGVCPAAAVATPYVASGLTAFTTAGYLRKGW